MDQVLLPISSHPKPQDHSVLDFDLSSCLSRIQKELPFQNPLFAFLHNNVLQSFEELPFFEALADVKNKYNANPLPSGEYYRSLLIKGTIKETLLEKECILYCASNPSCPLTWQQLKEVLVHPIKVIHFRENQILGKLFYFWQSHFGVDLDELWKESTIPVVASYLDQGQSVEPQPYSRNSLIECAYYSFRFFPKVISSHKHFISSRLEQVLKGNTQDHISSELARTGLPKNDWDRFLTELCFHLKGWSGMVSRNSADKNLFIFHSNVVQPIDFSEWVLFMLVSLNACHEYLNKKYFNTQSSIFKNVTASRLPPPEIHPNKYEAKQSPLIDFLKSPKNMEWFKEFSNYSRFQIWQESLEKSFVESHKDKWQAILSNKTGATNNPSKSIHFLFCIDDREESYRRILESKFPKASTAGVVGFFGLDMKFKSNSHPKFVQQCPPVVDPKHSASEIADLNFHSNLSRITSQYIYKIKNQIYKLSRTLFGGFLFSLLFGMFGWLTLVLNVFIPHLIEKFTRKFRSTSDIRPYTKIESDFSDDEKVKIVETICAMGELNAFDSAPDLVFVVGHGSETTNNPFKQAYGCGACSGNSGAINAKLFCEFANDNKVRTVLQSKGYKWSNRTQFFPLYHDTCTDQITALAPINDGNIKPSINEWLGNLKTVSQLNAHERLRVIPGARGKNETLSFQNAYHRAKDFAQPRPEYGHAGVKIAIFGKRQLTQGLDLDRSAFLVSYDKDTDPSGQILRSTLVGALPVCANIGLDYFFSASDPLRMGAGSKLGLNVTSLLGVMTGSLSDLRTGLASQMTEYHTPIRMHVLIDADQQIIKSIIESHPRLKLLTHNHWIKIFIFNEDNSEIREMKWNN